MQVGVYADGRPLSFDSLTSEYDVGGTPITLEQLRAYDYHDQIAWLPGYGQSKRALPGVTAATPSLDSPLSTTEAAILAAGFFFLPLLNVWVSSILYYVWRRDQPTRARQINRLGFTVFGCQILLFFLLTGCVAVFSV